MPEAYPEGPFSNKCPMGFPYCGCLRCSLGGAGLLTSYPPCHVAIARIHAFFTTDGMLPAAGSGLLAFQCTYSFYKRCCSNKSSCAFALRLFQLWKWRSSAHGNDACTSALGNFGVAQATGMISMHRYSTTVRIELITCYFQQAGWPKSCSTALVTRCSDGL